MQVRKLPEGNGWQTLHYFFLDIYLFVNVRFKHVYTINAFKVISFVTSNHNLTGSPQKMYSKSMLEHIKCSRKFGKSHSGTDLRYIHTLQIHTHKLCVKAGRIRLNRSPLCCRYGLSKLPLTIVFILVSLFMGIILWILCLYPISHWPLSSVKLSAVFCMIRMNNVFPECTVGQ